MDNDINTILNNSDNDIIESINNVRYCINIREFEINEYYKICKKYYTYKIVDKFLGDCSICLNTIEIDNRIYELKCNHIFHVECLNKWNKNTCPYCRSKIL
jgi:hypothetical protein